MSTARVSAGVYYVFDPSYIEVFKSDERFLWDCVPKSFSSFYYDNQHIYVWSTNQGPGCYPLYYDGLNLKTKLENIPTDSGKFSLIPKSLFSKLGKELVEDSYPVIFDQDTWIRLSDPKLGDVKIGDYLIVTSGTEPFEEELNQMVMTHEISISDDIYHC